MFHAPSNLHFNSDIIETPPFWHVEYDDGDQEDYAKKDLILALKHYGKHCKDDKNKNSA